MNLLHQFYYFQLKYTRFIYLCKLNFSECVEMVFKECKYYGLPAFLSCWRRYQVLYMRIVMVADCQAIFCFELFRHVRMIRFFYWIFFLKAQAFWCFCCEICEKNPGFCVGCISECCFSISSFTFRRGPFKIFYSL